MPALGLVGFRNRGQWEPGMEVRAEDRCQIGKSWVIAKVDHVTSESFAEDAEKWYYLVDARGLDDLDAKMNRLDALSAASEEATLKSRQATSESKAQTQAAQDATAIFTEIFSLFDHETYLYALCDAHGLVLWGIRMDGSVYQPKGIPDEVRKWLESLHTLEEFESATWLYAISDLEHNVLWGIRRDGTIYEPKGIPEQVASVLRRHTEQLEQLGMTVIENDDYAFAVCDATDHVVFAVDHNGRSLLNAIKGVCVVEQFDSQEYLFAVTDSADNLLFGVGMDGTFHVTKFALPKDLAEQIAKLTGQGWMSEDDKDKEFIYRIEDLNGLVVFGVAYSGDVYMPKGMPGDVRKELDKMAAVIQQHTEQIIYVQEHGKDWSGETTLRLPRPCVPAKVEINGVVPTSKFFPTSGTLKYSDYLGNSFEKPIMWNVQGNISSGFDKKNYSIDLLNVAGDEDSEFSVQFGDWVPQDSFHLKAYISDFLKIRSLGVYRHAEQVAMTRDLFKRRPWDCILSGAKQTTAQILKGGTGELDGDLYTGAMGHPDGFPFMLWINGEPWGLYTWNLKKHKDNYHVTKNDNDGKQLFFGDYPTGLFWHRNTDYWNLTKNYLSEAEAASYEKWDAAKGYNVGDKCYTEDTVAFTVNGKSSSVVVRRLWSFGMSTATYAGYDYDEEGYPCLVYKRTDAEGNDEVTRSRILNKLTMNPSHINWNNLEVRNPKKTICAAFAGNDEKGKPTYKLEYYDYDSPNDYAATGIYERTHEIISEDMFTQKEVTKLAATGETDTFSKKEYTRSINTRKTLEELSWVFPIIETTLTEQNLTDWGFESQADAKKAIFSEHWDTDHNIDFFLVLNDSYTIDSLTHNTLYTMYDGKKVFANHYDTDISFGMGSTYINSFGGVVSSIYAPGGTFMSYLYSYYKEAIKARWAELRDAATISKSAFAKGVVWPIVRSIGYEGYSEELRLWSQPSYRTAVYWRMPAGALKVLEDKNGKYHGYDESQNSYATMPAALKELYDADPESVKYDATKQYLTTGDVAQMYCVVGDGESLHWYQCTANCKGQHPAEHYTCGSPTSGGLYDTPQRIIEWFGQRLSYMDSQLAYTPSASAAVMEAIKGAVATDDDIMALFGQ